LTEGLTILAAARSYQLSWEEGQTRGGVFTKLLCAALEGGAANVLGDITLGAIYAQVETQLGAWDQRPLFKCHVASSVVLRKREPLVELAILKKIHDYFPNPEDQFRLDPTYEEDKHHVPEDLRQVDKDHEQVMSHFRKYATQNLLVPVGEDYLYWAAVHSKSCRLTEIGQYIWQMVERRRI